MTNAIDGKPLEVLTFTLADEDFALNASLVREILDFIPISDVPGAPPFMSGLINVRGKVVPLADPRLKLGFEPSEATTDTRIVVVEVELDGRDEIVGLMADKVNDVAVIHDDMVENTPKIGIKWDPEFVSCLGKTGNKFIHILDVARILSSVS